MRRLALPLGLLLVSGTGAFPERAQDPPAQVPTCQIFRASGPIAVDGRADEPAWQKAEPIDFVFPWVRTDGGDSVQGTVARMLWDDDNLYIVYVCDDPYLDSEVTEHDGPVYAEDAVEIFATPNPDDVSAYFGYEMNITPALLDYIAFEAGEEMTKNIQFAWQSEDVQIATTHDGTLNDHSDTDRGWILEIAIPFENFRHLGGRIPPKVGDMWRLNLNRTRGDRGRFGQWSDTRAEDAAFHHSAYFGKAYFSGNPTAGAAAE